MPAIKGIDPGLAKQLARIDMVPFDSIAKDKDFQGALMSSGLSRVIFAAARANSWVLNAGIYAAVGAKVNFIADTNLWTFLVANKNAVAKVMSSKGIEYVSGGKNTRKNKRSREGNRQKYGRKNKGRSLRKNKRSSRKKNLNKINIYYGKI